MPLYEYGVQETPRDERLGPHHPVVWVKGVQFRRTQSPQEAQQDPSTLSTRERVVFLPHQVEQDSERPLERAFALLRADAMHYVVRFIVSSEDEFFHLSQLYDNRLLPAARRAGLTVGRFLRAGYQIHDGGISRIEIEAYGDKR